ncbi:MAG: mechanosensitive ion channel family protein [Gemmatimonadota bacterium]|nr:mechanosensitive ion channel family protein [Gemmatimonadota bacterium]
MSEFLQEPWVQRTVLIVGGVLLGLLVERVLVERIRRIILRTRYRWDSLIVSAIKGLPTVWLASAGVYFAGNVGTVDETLASTIRTVLTVVVIGSAVVAGMRAAGGAVRIMSDSSPETLKSPTLVVNLARIAVGMLGVFIILQNLGINITPLITALGIGGLAVALALQDTLGNLFAGMQIIFSRQVRQGDFVALSTGEEGWVTDVKARNTTIDTFPDGNLVVVPNSVLANSIVKNFSYPETALWISVMVGVAYDSDLEHVERVTREVAKEVVDSVDGGVRGEESKILFREFGDSSINFEVRMLVTELRARGRVRHEFIKHLHRRYNLEGIEIPFPIRTVVMKGGGASA